jgi:hypothetical protein
MRMPCGECGGSGLVEGLGCDQIVWTATCPWCGGSGDEPPPRKRVAIRRHEQGAVRTSLVLPPS